MTFAVAVAGATGVALGAADAHAGAGATGGHTGARAAGAHADIATTKTGAKRMPGE